MRVRVEDADPCFVAHMIMCVYFSLCRSVVLFGGLQRRWRSDFFLDLSLAGFLLFARETTSAWLPTCLLVLGGGVALTEIMLPVKGS